MSPNSQPAGGAGGLWRLRLSTLASLAVLVLIGWIGVLCNILIRSPVTEDLAETAARYAEPLIPTGGFVWSRMNPHGIWYPVELTSAGVGGDVSRHMELWLTWLAGVPAALLHIVASLLAVGFVAWLGRPRVVSLAADARTYVLRAVIGVALLSAIPALALWCSHYPVRLFWGAAWYQATGRAWIVMTPLARYGPSIGAALLYAWVLVFFARRVLLRAAREDRRDLSSGRLPDSERCLNCGYEAGDLSPCPECGASDPRALPQRIYIGALHARLAAGRRRWVLTAAPIALIVACYAAPLLIGTARALVLIVGG